MRGSHDQVRATFATNKTYLRTYWRAVAAFADGPVADTAETVAAEAGRPIPEPNRNHSDTVTHP